MNCHLPVDTTDRGSTRFVPGVFSLTVTAVLLSAVLVSRNFAAPPASQELTNSLGMKFTTIPAGEFQMGCDVSNAGPGLSCSHKDMPLHAVWLDAYAIDVGQRHNAAADALATAELLLRLRAQAGQDGVRGFDGLVRLAAQKRWLAPGG